MRAALLSTVAIPALLFGLAAFAQPVQQSGTVTPGHPAMWTTNGVIQDAGTSAAGFLTSLGVTNNGGPGICVNSAPITQPYNQVCLGVTTNGGARFSSFIYNGATTPGLTFNINGNVTGFPAVTLPVTPNDVACFVDATGTLKDCGTVPSVILPVANGNVACFNDSVGSLRNCGTPSNPGTNAQFLRGDTSPGATWANALNGPIVVGNLTGYPIGFGAGLGAGEFFGSSNVSGYISLLRYAVPGAYGAIAYLGTTNSTTPGVFNNNPGSGPTTYLTAGQGVGTLGFFGDNGVNYQGEGGTISVMANSAWSTTNAEAYMALRTTPNGANTSVEHMRLFSSGGVGIAPFVSGTVEPDPGPGNLQLGMPGPGGAGGSLILGNPNNAFLYTIQPPTSTPATQNLSIQLPPTNGGNGNCLQTNGSGVTSWQACGGTGSTTIVAPQGRLTLVSKTPVMVASTPSPATTIYYDCFNGGSVPYYNGTDQIDTIPGCEASLPVAPQASVGGLVPNQMADIYWNHAGAAHLCWITNGVVNGAGWVADTGGTATQRGTTYTAVDTTTRPYATNKNNVPVCYNGTTNYCAAGCAPNTMTLLGTVSTDASTTTSSVSFTLPTPGSGGNAGWIGLGNAYNRVLIEVQVQDTAASWASGGAGAWRQAHGSTGNQVTFVSSLASDSVHAEAVCTSFVTVTSIFDCAVGLNQSTTPNAGVRMVGYDLANVYVSTVAKYAQIGLIGRNFLTWMEQGQNPGGGALWYGSNATNGSGQAGMTVSWTY